MTRAPALKKQNYNQTKTEQNQTNFCFIFLFNLNNKKLKSIYQNLFDLGHSSFDTSHKST